MGANDEKNTTPLETLTEKNLYQLEKLTAEKLQLSSSPLPKYLSDLTYQDAVNVAYLESKIYADNQNLKSEMSGLENSLIAKDINQVSKGRPNLSLKYHTPEGKIVGYLLAYQGVVDKDNNQQCIYIEDFATLAGQQFAAGRLLRGFLSLYKEHYLAKQNHLPLYFQAREKTSFRLVQRQLQHLGESLGVEFLSHELNSYQQGSDTMHTLLIEVKPGIEVKPSAHLTAPIGELLGKTG